MAKAVKFLLSGYEASGKSTLASTLKDALVGNCDAKEYGFHVPHFNLKVYEGMEAFIGLCNAKLGAYKERFGKLPDTFVLDTVTQLYTAMQKFNADKHTGFNIHSANNKDTLMLNDYIENTLIAHGINVVIVAHTTFDADTARHVIPASGQFAKAGSWLEIAA